MFSVLAQQAGPADTGYAGSDGPVPQKWVNGNGTSVRHLSQRHIVEVLCVYAADPSRS